MSTLYIGDSIYVPLTLFDGSAAYVIPSGSTVESAVIFEDQLLGGPWVVNESNPDGDWTQGIIVVEATPAQTAAITEGHGQFEIQVTTPGGLVKTFRSSLFRVRPGAIA